MVYLKLVLDDRKAKNDNIYAIVVRVTFNRKSTTISTGVRVHKKYWESTLGQVHAIHPNNRGLNVSINEFFFKLQKHTLNLESSEQFSIEALKQKMFERSNVPIKGLLTFDDYSRQLIKEMLAINKTGNAIIYRTATNRLMAYVNNRALKFKEIDYALLEGFKNSLLKDKVSANTISNYFRTIRAIYNRAIKAKLIERLHYPFNEITFKSERTSKRAIAIDELQSLQQQLELLCNI